MIDADGAGGDFQAVGASSSVSQCDDTGGSLAFSNAIRHCADLAGGGWHIPTIAELSKVCPSFATGSPGAWVLTSFGNSQGATNSAYINNVTGHITFPSGNGIVGNTFCVK